MSINWRDLTDRLEGKAPKGAKRSSKWRATRDKFLKGKVCAVCGGKKKLIAHHKVPFHLAPYLELDEENLEALCEDDSYGVNCHLLFGHAGNFRKINLNLEADIAYWHQRLKLE